jgi:hypothetical protein
MDADSDTVPDSLDNCPDVQSVNLLDDDDDGVGNLCDQATNPQGDVDCDQDVDVEDARLLLVFVAGGDPGEFDNCPEIGITSANPFGDLNCDTQVTARDALFALIYAAGSTPPNVINCRTVGS